MLLALILAAPAWPRSPVVAFVCLTEVDLQTFEGFRAGMAERGYRDGATIHYVDNGPARTQEAIAQAVRTHLDRGVDLLVTASSPVTKVAVPMARDKGVPLVFAPVNDPVGAGVVASLRHPGGNATGIRLPAGDDLRLHFLTQLAPAVRHVLLPLNPDDPSARNSADIAEAAAAKLGLTVTRRPVRSAAEVQALFASLPEDVDALFLPRDSVVNAQIAAIVAAARRRRLPIAAPGVAQVHQGALFSYGFVHFDIGRRAARLADQILKGLPAGDLPVETPEHHLAINVATARALGLDLPPDILAQADLIVDR